MGVLVTAGQTKYDLPGPTRDPEFVLKIKGDPNPTNLPLNFVVDELKVPVAGKPDWESTGRRGTLPPACTLHFSPVTARHLW